MKATIVLIADNEAENFGRKLMLTAHRWGGMGFEMARLPQHVSLKQPFSIGDIEKMERFFDRFAEGVKPVDIQFSGIELFPSNVLGGEESGCLCLRVMEMPYLKEVQKRLNEELTSEFGPCPAEHDDDYIFHMTFAIGGTTFSAYRSTYDKLKGEEYAGSFRFSKLGLFYYDDDNISPGSYFCYKVQDL